MEITLKQSHKASTAQVQMKKDEIGIYAKVGYALAQKGLQDNDELYRLSVDVATEYINQRDGLTEPKMTSEMYVNIIELVICNYFRIGVELLSIPTRKRSISQIRHIIYYFVVEYKLNEYTFSLISSRYGQNHASVSHAHDKVIPNLIFGYKPFAAQIEDIRLKLEKEIGKIPVFITEDEQVKQKLLTK